MCPSIDVFLRQCEFSLAALINELFALHSRLSAGCALPVDLLFSRPCHPPSPPGQAVPHSPPIVCSQEVTGTENVAVNVEEYQGSEVEASELHGSHWISIAAANVLPKVQFSAQLATRTPYT